jgi:hypothetical protein
VYGWFGYVGSGWSGSGSGVGVGVRVGGCVSSFRWLHCFATRAAAGGLFQVARGGAIRAQSSKASAATRRPGGPCSSARPTYC